MIEFVSHTQLEVSLPQIWSSVLYSVLVLQAGVHDSLHKSLQFLGDLEYYYFKYHYLAFGNSKFKIFNPTPPTLLINILYIGSQIESNLKVQVKNFFVI